MHYVIIANGNFLIKEIIEEASQHKKMIALDGASNKLRLLNIKPDFILGDFDSIDAATQKQFDIRETFTDLTEDAKPYQNSCGTTIVPAKDQTKTDLMKAILYCDHLNAQSITLLCATGGRLDHHEGSIRALYRHYKTNRPIILHTESQTLCIAHNETLQFNGSIGDKCGFLAYPEAEISTKGLRYEAKNYPLRFGLLENICNELRESKVVVTVKGTALIVMPAHLSAQRLFMEKTEVERLELQLRDITP